MTNQESTSQASDIPATPVAPLPMVDSNESPLKIPAALTGLAGFVVGGLLFGKKGGLVAGLLGAGAKALLNQNRTNADPAATKPNTECHLPDEEVTSSTEFDVVAPKSESLLDISIPAISGEAKLVDAVPSSHAFIQEGETLLDAKDDQNLAEIAPQNPAERSCVEEIMINPPIEIPMPIQDQLPSPLSINSRPIENVMPDSTRAANEDPQLGEMGGFCSKQAGAPPNPIFNDPLDEVLEHSEGFRSLGDTWSQRAVPAMESPLSSPQVSPQADYSTMLPQLPDATLSLTTNFVQWPNSGTSYDPLSEPAADPIFQDYLTKMFNDGAQDLVPTKAASNDPITGDQSGTSARGGGAEFCDLENLPSLPNLTPEDIWRLAAQASETEGENGANSVCLQPLVPVDGQPDSGQTSLIKMLGKSADVSPLDSTGEPLVHSENRNIPPRPSSHAPIADVKIGEQAEPLKENSKLESISMPVQSPFSQTQQTTEAPLPPLSFPPRSIRLMDQEKSRKRRFAWGKSANLLLILGLLYAGYVFRAPLMKQWSGIVQGTEQVPAASPSPHPSRVIKDVPEGPQPLPPLPATETLPDLVPSSLEPPSIEPVPTKIEVRPAANLPDIPLQPKTPSEVPSVQTSPEDAVRREAEITVKNFLAATTIREVIPLIVNAEKLGQMVQKYYGGNVVPPTPYDSIVLDTGVRVPEANSRAFHFRVSSPDRRQGFPVCTEETPQGFKVEWEAFVQCRDRTHANFWKSLDAPTARLFVLLKRSHYFEEDVPNLEDYDCFSICSPNPDEDPVYAFAKKNSVFTQKYRTRIAWEASYFIVATFSHVTSSNGSNHVEIEDIERFSWRNLGN